jgi:hypothetical protein
MSFGSVATILSHHVRRRETRKAAASSFGMLARSGRWMTSAGITQRSIIVRGRMTPCRDSVIGAW